MSQQKELINILKAELTLLSQEILQNIHHKDIADLYKSVRKLYEKMAAVYVLDKKINEPELLSEIFSTSSSGQTREEKPEQKFSSSIKKEEDKFSAGTLGTHPEIEKNSYKQDISFVPKQKETNKTKKVSDTNMSANRISVPVKKMSIGLNDRIAFINNLFQGDEIQYSQTIEALNAFEDYEAALRYIYTEVKPRYNNWEGKDEYEFRLIQLLELKFN